MLSSSRTLIYAHRGAKREAAENTRSAFDKALAYSINGIETDIQLTRDGVCVLWHDDDLKKLGLPDQRIDDFEYAQLLVMNVAALFAGKRPLPNPLEKQLANRPSPQEGKSPAIPQGGEGVKKALRAMPYHESVMTLQDFIASYRTRCNLLLEIKRYPGENEARQQIKVRQTLALVGAAAGDAVLASSFDLDSLIYAHKVAPEFPLVFNLEPEHQADFAQHALNEQPWLHGLCVHIATLNEAMVGVAHEHNKRIAVYTCNSDEQINRALNLGVDVLISDVPQTALQMRDT
jgi:glycerophosphoryl diester phosphodiesterase